MAAIAADYIADIYNLSMKENDLIYLAIHFQAAIERMKDAVRRRKLLLSVISVRQRPELSALKSRESLLVWKSRECIPCRNLSSLRIQIATTL